MKKLIDAGLMHLDPEEMTEEQKAQAIEQLRASVERHRAARGAAKREAEAKPQKKRKK